MKWAVMNSDQECIGIWVTYKDAAEFVADNHKDGDLYAIPADELTEDIAILNG